MSRKNHNGQSLLEAHRSLSEQHQTEEPSEVCSQISIAENSSFENPNETPSSASAEIIKEDTWGHVERRLQQANAVLGTLVRGYWKYPDFFRGRLADTFFPAPKDLIQEEQDDEVSTPNGSDGSSSPTTAKSGSDVQDAIFKKLTQTSTEHKMFSRSLVLSKLLPMHLEEMALKTSPARKMVRRIARKQVKKLGPKEVKHLASLLTDLTRLYNVMRLTEFGIDAFILAQYRKVTEWERQRAAREVHTSADLFRRYALKLGADSYELRKIQEQLLSDCLDSPAVDEVSNT